MKAFLVDKIFKAVRGMESSTSKLEVLASGKRTTEFLNIEYNIGKYHAYMDCLKIIDIDKWAELHTRFEVEIKNAMVKIEQIYNK